MRALALLMLLLLMGCNQPPTPETEDGAQTAPLPKTGQDAKGGAEAP